MYFVHITKGSYLLDNLFTLFKPEERQNTFWDYITTLASTRSQLKEGLNGSDIVCCRGLLKRVAHAPYNLNASWKFSVRRVGDVIFLCESERYLNHTLPLEKQREIYRGFSFAEYVTVTGKDVTSTTDKSATNFEEFVGVMQSTLALGPKSKKPLKLFYNGEVDALYKETNVPVELKVTNLTNYNRNKDKINLEWFLHSYLMGITDLYVCYDVDEVVKKVDCLFVEDLCKASEVYVCMNVLHKVLSEVCREYPAIPCVLKQFGLSRKCTF
ncbi:unnamed protein product [Cylicocyclus nassatus]|uniref:Decapping nuclease n=1 Tax=Cylicocyclus nassatus TaxID=53992 RepID=A0AA36GNF1_CYLNA|nr:unnamed protein product [Cylicocyclus nassatus]